MENQFRINWPALISEAKQRRKKIKMTQVKLAMIAGVSTPTLSDFENGNETVQISSALGIFDALGMVDKRNLIFNQKEEDEVYYDARKQAVVFYGKDGEEKIQCLISREALEDHFDNDENNMKIIFLKNRQRIEYEARKKYLLGKLENDLSIMIRSEDL